jgi:hypothetical protein
MKSSQEKNKFFILGLPRSGTTAIANTLNACGDVYLYSSKKIEGIIDNESYLFEPFALANSKVTLDWKYKLKEVIEPNFTKKFNGFKVIPGDQVNIRSLVNDYGYRPLIVIRKDIWKVIFSKIAASYTIHDENTLKEESTGAQIGAYLESSRKAKADFSKFLPFVPRLEFFLGNFIKSIYELENEARHELNPIDIIYFEDFIQPNKTYTKINEYFGQEIKFNLEYDDSFNIIREYLVDANWTRNNYRYLASRIEANIQRFGIHDDPKVPSWLKEKITNNPFLLG